MTREEISQHCVASLARALRVKQDSIDPKAKFNRLGLDSAMIVYVMMELEEKLDLELTPDDFYARPPADELPRHLADRRPAAACRRPHQRIIMDRPSSLVALLAERARTQAGE